MSLLIFVPMRDVDLLMVFFEHGCGLSVCVKLLQHLWGCIFNVYLLRLHLLLWCKKAFVRDVVGLLAAGYLLHYIQAACASGIIKTR